MKIKDVVCATGTNAFVHKDLMAVKAGAVPNGFFYEGKTVTPGFDAVVQPGTIISVMLILDDGSVALGDCLDVIFTGTAGRDPLFRAQDHLALVEGAIATFLKGREVDAFRPLAEEFERQTFNGVRPHTAIRYGISQALLHAAAIAGRCTMAEIVAREYGTEIRSDRVPILVSVQKTDANLLDRMIMKEVELLPHASFTVVEADLGADGSKLIAFAAGLAKRIKEVGAPHYKPRIHLDTYGTIGELFNDDPVAIVDYLARVEQAVAPFTLLIESPVIAKTQAHQVDIYRQLRREIAARKLDVRLIVDEWCNTIEDIRLFAESDAADFVQIKMPDLGGIGNSIEAVTFCRSVGMGCCLGGTANETDQSSRITTHIGMACSPDFLLGKPGLGGDEALMIQRNEMARTLALVAYARR